MPITTMQVEMNASVWRKDGDEGSGYQTYGVHGAARKKKTHAADEIKGTPQKCSPPLKRSCETIARFALECKLKSSLP